MSPIPRALTALNGLATAFSLWWLSAHILRGRIGDWEFWFALGYLLLCAINLGAGLLGGRKAAA